MKANRHPIDQLADVRAEIKALTEEERRLKDEIMSSLPVKPRPDDSVTLMGDEHIAKITVAGTERLDRKEVEKRLSKPKFQECLKTSMVTTIRTTPRAQANEAA